MEKEIRLANKLTTEKIDNKEFVERIQKRFEGKNSTLTASEKKELRRKILKKKIGEMID